MLTVTADERAWFARCHRAWDLGARARQGLQPRAVPPPGGVGPALLAALAIHYFPGMWTWDRAVVDPLVRRAYDDAGGPADGRRLLTEFQRWAPGVDRFTPVRVQYDLEAPVPRPGQPGAHLATATGAAVRYRQRVPLVAVDEDERCWLVEHRVVDAFAAADELALDEAGLAACWAWTESELAPPPAGTQYTELRLAPPGARRTVVPRSAVAIAEAGARLGRAVAAMLDPTVDVDPTPAWSHCRVCPFRIPCVAMQRGEDAGRLLATGYERRPPEELEEGRLGGTSWGLGRGARPPRW